MQKLRPRSKAFMIVDHEMERSTLWCLCGRLYVFNGVYNNNPSSITSQVSCSCYGEGLQGFNTVKVVSIQPNSFTNGQNAAPIDSANNVHVDYAPYSVSRKTTTIYYTYTKTGRKLEESAITSGYTIKAVPGQVPKVLKWMRGGGKDDVKTVTYMGGAASLNSDFIMQAWTHLRPNTHDQTYTRAPHNGIDLIYFLALPALAKTGELSAMADRFSRKSPLQSNTMTHLNPDAHLLHTLVAKGDVIDHKSPEEFLNMVTGIKPTNSLNVDILNANISWPTLHFMSFALKDSLDDLSMAVRSDGIQWAFYDTMLSDRVMSNYMDDLWALFKWLKTKMNGNQIANMVRAIATPTIGRATHINDITIRTVVARKVIDVLATYRKLSNRGFDYLADPAVTIVDNLDRWQQVEQFMLSAYRLSNEGELANAGQGPAAPTTRSRGRISSRSVSRPSRRRTR